MLDDKAYWKWVQKPIVGDGRKGLIFDSGSTFDVLNDDAVKKIVKAVNEWYSQPV